jgi:DNA polymerase-3 subunit gamma/tau
VYLSLDNRSESYLTGPREKALAEALSTHFGEDLKVDIAVGAAEVETPTQMEARQETEELEAARIGLESDPNVKALKDMFGAELVPGSVEPLANKSAASQE